MTKAEYLLTISLQYEQRGDEKKENINLGNNESIQNQIL